MTPIFDIASLKSPAQTLSDELLVNLRRKCADVARGSGDIDLADPSESLASPAIPVEQAMHCIRFAQALGPHFRSIGELFSSRALVVVRFPDEEAHDGIIDALRAGLRGVEPHLEPFADLAGKAAVVLESASDALGYGSLRRIKLGLSHALTTIVLLPERLQLPMVCSGADLFLQLRPLDSSLLGQLFEACHTTVPTNLDLLPERLAIPADLVVSNVRRGRTAEACIEGIAKAVLVPEDKHAQEVKRSLQETAGYGEAKDWGLELASDLALWREGKLTWGELDHRAIVLSGPPGCGKTSFAAILANTLDLPLISTSVAQWNAHDNLSGTLKAMRSVFDQAMTKAPAVLFIDELDGISSRGSIAGRHSEYWTQVVNLLLELVSASTRVEGLILVGATNFIDRIDPALLRAGRLEQVVRIALPDAEARVEILRGYLKSPFSASALRSIADLLDGRSGADIERLVRSARAMARRSRRDLTLEDLREQIPNPAKPLSARTLRRIAVYERGQWMVARELGWLKDQGQPSGPVWPQLASAIEDREVLTEQDSKDILAILLAGRVAEEIVLGDCSSISWADPNSDLRLATSVARDIECRAGWGEAGIVCFDDLRDAVTGPVLGSIRRRLDEAVSRAHDLLMSNMAELEHPSRIGAAMVRSLH